MEREREREMANVTQNSTETQLTETANVAENSTETQLTETANVVPNPAETQVTAETTNIVPNSTDTQLTDKETSAKPRKELDAGALFVLKSRGKTFSLFIHMAIFLLQIIWNLHLLHLRHMIDDRVSFEYIRTSISYLMDMKEYLCLLM